MFYFSFTWTAGRVSIAGITYHPDANWMIQVRSVKPDASADASAFERSRNAASFNVSIRSDPTQLCRSTQQLVNDGFDVDRGCIEKLDTRSAGVAQQQRELRACKD